MKIHLLQVASLRSNKYRIEPNYFGDTWAGNLKFELNIIKDICTEENTDITKADIREITRWLTSPHLPQWIEFEYSAGDDIQNNFEAFSAEVKKAELI